jgi:hypothetical protein
MEWAVVTPDMEWAVVTPELEWEVVWVPVDQGWVLGSLVAPLAAG